MKYTTKSKLTQLLKGLRDWDCDWGREGNKRQGVHTQFRAYVLHNKGNIAPIYTTSVCKRQTKNFFLYLISYFFGSFIGLPSLSLYPPPCLFHCVY